MTAERFAEEACAHLHAQVSGFFSNTRRGPGFCAVCTGPGPAGMCGRCATHRAQYGERLADLVVPLAYVRGWMTPKHQSEHHVWQYKHRAHPSARCMQDLQLMILAATALHGRCMARAVGRGWDAVTFVPSATRPGPEHPVSHLARQVTDHSPHTERILLAPGPNIEAERHNLVPDRFAVPPEYRRAVTGRHVLVVDDTWVSGGNAQAAALALREVAARTVTVLCVGRWLSWNRTEHQPFMRLPVEPYDARLCPVTATPCQR